MIPSKYNFIFRNDENAILYNAFSDEMVVMLPEILKIYQDNLDSIERIKDIHPDLYACLLEKSAIVEEDEDESLKVIERWNQEEQDSGTYLLTINPTLNCNMSCWYCYEQKRRTYMKGSIMDSTLNLIKSISQSPKYNHIILSFFGGEPLLYFKQVVLPIVNGAKEICNRENKSISLNFTTNGYLISDNLFKVLGDTPVSFQITLDGNKSKHNEVKKIGKVSDSFSVTVKNIKLCLRHGCQTTVRLNFTIASLSGFAEIVKEFFDLEQEEKKLLNINFQKIWQDKGKMEYDELVENVRAIERMFMEEGMQVSPFTSNSIGRCYGDNKHSAVINYDGNVYKCTARDFNEKNREGTLSNNGIIVWNEKHELRRKIVYGGVECKECSIYPLCHGGCSQHKLDSFDTLNECIKGFDEQAKLDFIKKRIEDLITMYQANNNG